MKLLIITHLFLPDRGGGASVFTDFCTGLAERGHEVYVYSGYPYYPEWANKSKANLLKIKKESICGVKLYRHGFYIPKRPSSLWERLVYEISFTISLLRSLFRVGRCDGVVVYCPLFGSILFSVLRKILFRERLWINIQDIPADAADAAGIGKNRLFKIMSGSMQKWFFRSGDIISTISEIMARRVTAILGDGRRAELFPNWLNASMQEAITELRPRNVADKPLPIITLLYAGNVGRKQGLKKICEYLSATPWSFIFRICGEGSEMADLKLWVQGRKDSRFQIEGFLSERDFVQALYCSNFFIITETPDVGGAFIPSKLIPCIAVETPILAICDNNGPLGMEVSLNNLGPLISWDSLYKIERLLDINTEQSQEYAEWKSACNTRAMIYSRNVALDKAVEILGRL